MKLLLIEDDPELLAFLAAHLPDRGFVVDAAPLAAEGLSLARRSAYDLIVLDLHLPDMAGDEVIAALQREVSQMPPVLMLTAVGDTETKTRLLWAGADDYLTKPFSFDELVARIHALLRRSRDVTPAVLTADDLCLDMRKRTVTRAGKNIPLTAKEYQLLEYLMRNRGTVIPKTELIEHAWGASVDPFSNAIETHLTNLRRKLGEPAFIQNVHGRGYVIEP